MSNFVINPYQFVAAAGSAYVFDNLSSGQQTATEGCYAFRKLRDGYTGYCCKLRNADRSNVEVDVAFDSNDKISGTSAVNPTTWGSTLADFHRGTDTCYLSAWYDETTNAFNVIMGTASEQPRVVNAGTIETSSGGQTTISIIANTGLEFGSAKPSMTSLNWVQYSSDSTYASFKEADSTSEYLLFCEDASSSAWNNNVGTPSIFVDGTSESPTTRDDIHTLLNAGEHIITLTDITLDGTWAAGNPLQLYVLSWNSYIGDISEVWIFSSDPDATDRSTLEDDQKTYYSIA